MMKMSPARFRTAVLLSAGLLAVPVFAQDKADQARLDEIARTAAQQFAARRVEGEQTRPNPALDTTGTTFELTLDDAVARAMDRNLDVAVERLNPEVQELNLTRLTRGYRPALTSTLTQRSQTQLPTTQLNGGTSVNVDTSNYNAGIAQNIPWGGGNYTLAWNNQKQLSNSTFVTFNPTFNSNLIATYTQPLLRSFLIDGTRQQIKVTAINRDISDAQFRGVVATTLANVRNAYWELLYASQALDVARGSLDLAQKLVEDNQARVEVGTMAPLDVVQSQAEAATRRQAVAQAEATLKTDELSLKRMIVSGTDDPLWRATLVPVDRPTFGNEKIDVETAVRKALAERTDLAAARKTVEANDVTMKYLHNQSLPAVDAVASYQSQGLGGTQLLRASQALGGQVTGTVPGGYFDALNTLFNRAYPIWQVQLNVTYPIGGSSADASYARSKVQRSQAAAQLKALELSVATEVTNAALQIDSGLKQYEAATAARELAEQRLSAEQSRFEVGLSTNYFVVQAQRDLATAQNTELRALLSYRQALVNFDRAQAAPAVRGGNTVQTIQTAGGGN
jgi:outer membrane protein TolC